VKSVEVLFTPAEFNSLAGRNLSEAVCAVFDILRATSSMVTALASGAAAIVPVLEISDALAFRDKQPDVLLAGERNGRRIQRDLTGSIDFDLGNSPREFTRQKVQGKTIVMTTTNGTRALRACAGAQAVFVGSFLNMRALSAAILAVGPENLLVVCSGTHEEAAYEDTLAAGALCDLLWGGFAAGRIADSVHIARDVFLRAQRDLVTVMRHSRNAQRLLAISELAEDVPYCLAQDTQTIVPTFQFDGNVRV